MIVVGLMPARSPEYLTLTWPFRRLNATSSTIGATVSITNGPWAALGSSCMEVVVLPDSSTAAAVIVLVPSASRQDVRLQAPWLSAWVTPIGMAGPQPLGAAYRVISEKGSDVP